MPLPALFHLAIDDGGEYLAAAGEAFVLGHLRSQRAELRFLADLESEHARLARRESFHGGVEWIIEPLGSAEVHLAARRLEGPRALGHGDRLQLGRNLCLSFRQIDAASSSALLELEGQAECEGVRRILLFSPGAAGRVRIGSRRGRPVAVPDLLHEVTLELQGDALLVRCQGGLRCGPESVPPGPGCALALPLPPAASLFVETGARARPGAPFTLALRPSEHQGRGAPSARGA